MTHPQKIIKPRLLTADPGTTKYIVGELVGSRQHRSRGSGHLFLILAGVCLGVSPFIPAFAVVGFGALICGAMVMLALRESLFLFASET